MIKNVEIELYGENLIVEVEIHSNDDADFDISTVKLIDGEGIIDVTSFSDNSKEIEEDILDCIAEKLKQEALNNV